MSGQSAFESYGIALSRHDRPYNDVEVRAQRERMRVWLMKETKAENTAYTFDNELVIPGINAETAGQLSTETGMVISSNLSSESLGDQAIAKAKALQTIKTVKDGPRPDPRAISRMEYDDSLMQFYQDDRKKWETQRDEIIRNAADASINDPEAAEKVIKALAHTVAIEDAKLASKYNDAIIRGYGHNVRELIGHLSSNGTADDLQAVKDSYRESSMSFQPGAPEIRYMPIKSTDWFDALDANFGGESSSHGPELVKAAGQAKSQVIDAIQSQIADLQGSDVVPPPEATKKADDTAKNNDITSGTDGRADEIGTLQTQLANAKSELTELQEAFPILQRNSAITDTVGNSAKDP